MRKTSTFFAALCVAVLLLAEVSAQDAAAPFRRSSPTPTPEPSATPAPSRPPVRRPSPTPAQSPTAAPVSTPAPKPAKTREKTKPAVSRSSRDSLLNQKPVRAVERRGVHDVVTVPPKGPGKPFVRRIAAPRNDGPRASRPTFDLSESSWATAATIRSLENKWQKAVKNHDADTIDKLLANDFQGTSVSGETASKSRLLREVKRDKNGYKSVRARGMSVRNTGPDLAVVTGTSVETGTTKEGKPFTSSRRFSDTWRQRKGKWLCISSKASKEPKR